MHVALQHARESGVLPADPLLLLIGIWLIEGKVFQSKIPLLKTHWLLKALNDCQQSAEIVVRCSSFQ